MNESTKETIRRIRASIYPHRAQRGDDRCWLDDYLVWRELSEPCDEPYEVPDDAMERCHAFYELRRSETADIATVSPRIDTAHFDDADLEQMNEEALQEELARLTERIRSHRDIRGRKRTIDDDRRLYEALPDQQPADFRLPPRDEFLGEAGPPHSGCPRFWRSHADCQVGRHDFHRWGPCPPKG